jgi:hypothetical protein
MKLRILAADPKRVKDLTEIDEPQFTKSKTLSALPNRAQLLNEMLLPKVANPSMLIAEPSRAHDRTEMEEANPAKLRIDIAPVCLTYSPAMERLDPTLL